MNVEPYMRIIAIDPGEDCGFALWSPMYNTCNVESNQLNIKAWQTHPTQDEFLQTINECHPDIIVCESFDHRQKDNKNYSPLKRIGLVEWYVERRGIELVFQTPSFAKAGFFDNVKLKKLGLYQPGDRNEDAMVALKHLLQFRLIHGLFDLNLLK